MAISYPDVIGEYTSTTQRFAVNGLQLTGYFEPTKITPGETANLHLFLQSTLNVPITAQLSIELPQSGGFLQSKKPQLKAKESLLNLKLAPAEAGVLIIPVTTTEHVKNGALEVKVEIKSKPQGKGKRIRPQQSTSKLANTFFPTMADLNLVGVLGATYEEKPIKKAPFTLTVSGKPNPDGRAPQLDSNYQTLWVESNMQFFNQAIQELNSRQVKLKDEMNVEPLYVNLYGESVARFSDAGLPMRIGEAVIMAKILTYSCQYFLSSPKRQNGLLVPIWERALAAGGDTTDALDVLRGYGFYHILKLSTAMSFGIISRTFKKQFWSIEEQQVVSNHIADSIETGQAIDLEFLYLPLLMAGTQISGNVKLQGENVSQTLALMQAARTARASLFIDEDMAQADKIYDKILKNAAT